MEYANNTECYCCGEVVTTKDKLAHICMCIHEEYPRFRGICKECVENESIYDIRSSIPRDHRIKSLLSNEEETKYSELHDKKERDAFMTRAMLCLFIALLFTYTTIY